MISLIDNMFFNEKFFEFSYERLKTKYFSKLDDDKWNDILKRDGMIDKYESYLNFTVLILKEIDVSREKELPKLILSLKKRYLILSNLKRKEEKIFELIEEIHKMNRD